MYGLRILGVVAVVWVLGCQGTESPTDPGGDPPDPPVPQLAGDPSSHCYRWPEAAFTQLNFAPVETGLSAGEPAVEFELRDIEDRSYRLSELLADKPVLLVLGSYT